MDTCNHFYGNDDINVQQICGYSNVYVENLYGDRLQAHFHCSLNITNDPLLLLTIRCVNGLALSALSTEEQEIAARAIQCGYLQKNGDILEPAIVVLEPDSQRELWNVFAELLKGMKTTSHTKSLESSEPDSQTGLSSLVQALATELAEFMKKNIPTHLIKEYAAYNTCIASNHFFHDVVEECISQNILNAPKNPLGPEGVLMVLKK